MALLSATKLSAKLGVFGGAVYLTTKNGILDRDPDQSLTAIKNLTENVDNRLGGSYLSKVPLPGEMNLVQKWNNGVHKSFNFLADAPDKVGQQCNKGVQFVSKKWTDK